MSAAAIRRMFPAAAPGRRGATRDAEVAEPDAMCRPLSGPRPARTDPAAPERDPRARVAGATASGIAGTAAGGAAPA